MRKSDRERERERERMREREKARRRQFFSSKKKMIDFFGTKLPLETAEIANTYLMNIQFSHNLASQFKEWKNMNQNYPLTSEETLQNNHQKLNYAPYVSAKWRHCSSLKGQNLAN